MKKLEIDRNVIGRGSTMIHDQTYYEPTYLYGDRIDVSLFLYRDVTYKQASGTIIKRTLRDVATFATTQEMADAIESSDWAEGVDR